MFCIGVGAVMHGAVDNNILISLYIQIYSRCSFYHHVDHRPEWTTSLSIVTQRNNDQNKTADYTTRSILGWASILTTQHA